LATTSYTILNLIIIIGITLNKLTQYETTF